MPPTPPEAEINDIEADVPKGFSVLERVVTGQGRRIGRSDNYETAIIERGYVLRYSDGTKSQYCGVTGRFHIKPQYVDCLIKTRDDAENMAQYMAHQWNGARRVPVYEMELHSIDLPYCKDVTMKRPMQINARLNTKEAQIFSALRTGLRQQNAEWANGRPIDSNVDVLRYLLYSIDRLSMQDIPAIPPEPE